MGSASGAFETIVACITGPVWGQGAIAGVRISGSEAIPIARNVFPALPANPETHKAVYGVFTHGDDGLALPFLGTASYTGEPTVEFFVHGSTASVQLLIEACLKHGARIAEPGEFTSRAFLNGKMDLTQAEAVAELIAAKTESHLKAAQNQRQGALSRAVRNAWQPLTAVIVALEAWLDFSEEIGDLDPNSLITELESSRTATRNCMANGLGSQWIRDGLRVALLGKPNAGKSSLFNRLVGSDRAIVTDIPGTTRDVLEHTVIHRGILLRFLDTAGLRQTEDLVEKIGVERSHEAFEQADLRLYLCEDPLDPDLETWRKRPRTLTVITKGDLQNSPSTQDLQISVETNEGIEQLLDWLANHYSSVEPPYLLNIRHTELLQEAEEELALAIESLQAQEPAELTLAPLRAAERALRQIIGISEGSISGEGIGPDLLSAIFSRFCIGK